VTTRRAWSARAVGVAAAAVISLCALSACPAPARDATVRAEALLIADEVTHWLRVTDDSLRMVSAPLRIALVDSALLELYVAEDTREHDAASFACPSVYVRNIVRGDSTRLFGDSVCTGAALAYARTHPEDPQYADGQDPADDPQLTVESSIAIGRQLGPYIAVEVHTDHTRGDRFDHDTYWRTLDLTKGEAASPHDVVGATAARRHRDSAAATLIAMRTAARAAMTTRAGSDLLARLRAGDADYHLARGRAQSLALQWLAHARDTAEVHSVPLSAMAVDTPPAWWAGPRRALTLADSGIADTLQWATRTVTIQHDSTGLGLLRIGRQSVRVVGRIRELVPLDGSVPLVRGWRPALERAFAEANYYSPDVRAVRATPDRRARPFFRPVSR
jgi:hypothetical protein